MKNTSHYKMKFISFISKSLKLFTVKICLKNLSNLFRDLTLFASILKNNLYDIAKLTKDANVCGPELSPSSYNKKEFVKKMYFKNYYCTGYD